MSKKERGENMKLLKTICALTVVMAMSSMAETILPVDYSSNSEFSAGWGLRTIVPGLYGAGAQTPNTVTGLRHTGSGWVTAANAVNPYIQYDLGGQYNLTALNVYNGALAGNYNRGVQTLKVEVSNNGTNWTTAVASTTLAQTTGTGAEWQTVSFTANNSRYVRLTSLQNYGSTYTELAKVQFTGTGAAGQTNVTPDSATTTMGAFSTLTIDKTIDLSGIRTTSDMANSTADDSSAYNWISTAGSTTGDIIWSFNEPQDLQTMLVWNGNDGGAGYQRGVNQYDLLVSTDASGENWTSVVTDGTLVYTSASGVWCGPQAIGIDQAGVRRVKMVVDSNHGDAAYTMLQEVSFVASVRSRAPALYFFRSQ
jgi:hypothetical protein